MHERFEQLRKIIIPEIMSRLEDKEPGTLYPLMNDYFNRGGKLLRPTLCMLGCEITGTGYEKAIPTSCALEFFQNFALVHDDIEDGSLLRRGTPCLHRKHGIPLALNAGDALLVRTFSILSENHELLGGEKSHEIMDYFIKGMMETVEGQAIDLGWVENKDFDISEKDYLMMAGKKTGVYTGSMPLVLGGMIGGAGRKVLENLKGFGSRIAIAFQIRDDLLNFVGSEEKYGKEIGGDLNEGKRTLIIIHYLKNANDSEKDWMKKVLEEKDNSHGTLMKAIKKLKDKGSIKYAEKKAEELVKESLVFLEKLPGNGAKDALRSLADFMIKRNK